MPDTQELTLEGIDTPIREAGIQDIIDAPTMPLDKILEPRKPDLSKSQRDEIVRMVASDFKRDWDSRSQWRQDRSRLLDRYRMKPEPKTDPWEGCANIRLPTIQIAVHATQARMMASVYGNDPAVKVKGVNVFGRENKESVETLMHWDARVREGGDFKLLYRVSHDVCVEGGRPIYTYWDRDYRFIQEAVLVYVNDLTGEIVLDPTTGEPFPGDKLNPILLLNPETGETATLVQKVVETERPIYDAPRSIDLDPRDFLVPYDAKGIQYPDAAHNIVLEREHFSTIKQKFRTGEYYLNRKEIGKIRNYVESGTIPPEEEEDQADQTLSSIEGIFGAGSRRLAENELRLVRWFGRYDLNGDGIDEECIFLAHPETEVLFWWAFLDDIYQHGKRPFAYPRFRLQPGRFDGYGLAQLLQYIDDALNALVNIAIDWGKINNVPYFFYLPTALEDEEIKLQPGKGVPVAQQNGVWFPQRSSSIDFALQLMQVLQHYIERVTLVSDETVGRQSTIAKSRATRGGTLAVIGEGNIGFELTNRLFLDEIKEMYTQRLQLYQQYMPEGMEIAVLEGEDWEPKIFNRDMISGQYQFEIEADAVSGNKMAQRELSLAMFQIFGQYLQTIYPAGVVELARKAMKNLGEKDVEKVLPKEVVEFVQQGQQLQAQLEQMERDAEIQAKLSDAEVKKAVAESKGKKEFAETLEKGTKALVALGELMEAGSGDNE